MILPLDPLQERVTLVFPKHMTVPLSKEVNIRLDRI